MLRTMNEGTPFALAHYASQHATGDGHVPDMRMAGTHGDRFPRGNGNVCLLMKASFVQQSDSTHAGADKTESNFALRKSSEHTRAIAIGEVVQRS